MRNKESVIFANMCMISDGNGNVLVQNRADKNWPGIVFPGGHVEDKEPFIESTIREIFEETGLNISKLKLCGIKHWTRDDGGRYVVLLYKTSTFSGVLKSSDEGEVFWTGIQSLNKLPLADGFSDMLNIFLTDEYSELYYTNDQGNWTPVLK